LQVFPTSVDFPDACRAFIKCPVKSHSEINASLPPKLINVKLSNPILPSKMPVMIILLFE